MKPDLSQFEISLLSTLQQPLPVCERPFAEIACALETAESDILAGIDRLKAAGVIRRFRAHISYRALGRIASLVTAHVPHEKFDAVADAVNRLPGVSHNYCRQHHYNLWFTLQAGSLIAIDVTLAGLRDDFDIEFRSLPAERLFKLSFQLDCAGPDPARLCAQNSAAVADRPVADVPPVPVELTDAERAVLSAVQQELPLTQRPFEALANMPAGDVYAAIRSLQQKGVLSRFAAVCDYTKLGYTANAMCCLHVPEERVSEIGTALASYNLVSHCYHRRTFAAWPFGLYAMCHAGRMETIENFAQGFTDSLGLQPAQVLPTVCELKKEPVQISV